jgi:membrane protein
MGSRAGHFVALIFKYLPDVIIGWRSVWIGAFLASLLFTLGKEILSIYFGEASPGSVYGAAGSIVIILLWVSYSCLILFFGAEFTWVFTKRYGRELKPKSHARFENDKQKFD